MGTSDKNRSLEDDFAEFRSHLQELVILICKTLYIDKLADWLESKLSKWMK